jgi:hypothetical protein
MPDDAADLYSVPLSEFIRERDALAARLKDGGQKEEAARIKALRKPSVAVWALNQLAQRRPDEVADLIRTGDRLRSTQEETLQGGDAADLRTVAGERNRLVARLADEASSILDEAGSAPGPHLEKIKNTLLAATSDQEAADLLGRGVLTTELAPSGFEGIFGMAAPPEGGPEEADGAAERETLERSVRKLEAAANEAEKKAARLVAKADEAERVAEDSKRRAADAVETAKQARAEADSASAGL